MKQKKKWWLTGAVVLVAIVIGGMLLSKSSALNTYFMEKKVSSTLNDYAENVVKATLTTFAADVGQLHENVVKLQKKPSDANLEQTAGAWRTARNQWQKVRSFFYGPGVYYDFNRQIATFPVDRPMIDYVVGEMAAERFALDLSAFRRDTRGTQRGLLAIEYLLFREGKPRSAEAVSAAELTYLELTSRLLEAETLDFIAAWFGTDSLNATQQQLVKSVQVEIRAGFVTEFTQPGTAQSRYFSSSVVLQDILGEITTAIGDVCDVIPDDLGSEDFFAGETWFSNNRFDDLRYALKGAENAFFGGEKGERRAAVADLVEAHDELLKKQIDISFVQAEKHLEDVGAVAAGRRDLALRKAQTSCNALLEKVNAAILPVCLDPATRPYAAYGL